MHPSGEIILLFFANSALVTFRSCSSRNGFCILKMELRSPARCVNAIVELNFAFPCSRGNFGVSIMETICPATAPSFTPESDPDRK